MTMSAATTYFQGGDFVELLSAQGKAPAATWKLQGKILKAFDKSIKGNAFQLDGSAETRMQLPKTATTQSLGLAQRFLVFQLAIPCARSFSIEVGFSDFQKIRRRFVFASAFRETARTSLHVQIPFDARVTRDQWINLVFDLQALTETCFPSSTFRAMESICISGSCKLKRIFTTKDAPSCDPASLQHKLRASDMQSQRAMLPASYADMKDIPKQFAFSSSAGPIPTEYFVLASTCSGARETVAASAGISSGGAISRTGLSSHSGGKSAPPLSSGAGKQKFAAAAKPGSGRPMSSAAARAPSRSGLKAHSSPRALSPTPSNRVYHEYAEEARPSSSRSVKSSTSSLERPDTAKSVRSRLSVSEVSDERPRTVARSLSSRSNVASRQQPQRYETRDRSSFSSEEEEDFSSSGEECDQPLIPQRSSKRHTITSPLPVSSTVAAEQTELAAQTKSSTEINRRAIIAAIQEKLDILSDDDEQEAERNSRLFLQHTSILTPTFSHNKGDAVRHGDDTDQRVRNSADANTNQHSRSSDRAHPEILSKPALESIFSFATSLESMKESSRVKSGDIEAYQTSVKSMKSLFDFDSLLASPSKESTRSEARSSVAPKETEDIKYDKAIKMDAQAYESSKLDDDDEDDRTLEELLIAKRNARRSAFESMHQTINTLQPRLSLDDLVVAPCDDHIEEAEVEEEQELGGESEIRPAFESPSKPQEASPIKAQYSPAREESNRNDQNSDEDDNLSIDLTDDLDVHAGDDDTDNEKTVMSNSLRDSSDEVDVERDDINNHAEDNRSEGSLDGDTSFDFDDLVEEERTKPDAAEDKGDTALITPELDSSPLRKPRKASIKSQVSKRTDSLEFSMSPLRSIHTDKSSDHHESRAESVIAPRNASFSSSRRLASLLESTDWSQLQSSPALSAESRTEPSAEAKCQSGGRKHQQQQNSFEATRDSSAASIELVYDPLLNCYYDPVANKYYALASE